MQGALFEANDSTAAAPVEKEARYCWRDDEPRTESAAVTDLFGVPETSIEKFASGSSAVWDMAGYMLVGQPVGVTATEMVRDERIAKLRNFVDGGGRAFVDSGAFGAFRANAEVDFERRVFPIYDALLAGCRRPGGFLLVMPDMVGDAAGTARLQRIHRDKILDWMRAGAECCFPLQNGHGDAIGAYRQVEDLTGGLPFVVGIPSNAKAWTRQQTVRFAHAVKPRRMHLLGLAKQRSVAELELRIHEASPATVLSCDACQILANVGVGRRITDRSTSRLRDAVDWLAGGAWLEEDALTIPDLSTYLYDIWYEPGFLTAEQARAMALELGCSEEVWVERFARASASGLGEVLGELDPDEEWLHAALADYARRELYGPWVEGLLRGPIRAWEVARLACKDDPETYLARAALGAQRGA